MKKYMHFRLNTPPLSFLVDRKALVLSIVLVVLVLATVILSTGLGAMYIAPLDVVKALFGVGDPGAQLVVLNLRLPRILVALLVGIALGVAGAIMQSLIRNPLASPDIVGITGGASVAAVAFITLFEGVSVHFIPFAAFVGAALVTLLIYVLAWKNGVTPLRLVLVGVGIGSAMTALTTLLIVAAPIQLTSKAMIWLAGTVYGSSWQNVLTILPWVLVFVPLAIVFARSINVQQLGDEVATGVGNPVHKHRFLLLMFTVALAGSAVAVGGAIGFVGLLAPHIARKLVGSALGALIPTAGLFGGLIVLLADLIGRLAFEPLDVPVGIFTAAIGAPFFIFLLYKHRNQ
ncbi:iron complex transport system permease protein [Tumebacillus sp. BK434]|uniref:FecCD family ABC transporter permease n=1 Tax=Tumebacillus sp. BK434 TaxID=2512169 RepID=UPI00105314D1|nr:iron ABC transporter permease [Tumebacillus sp. BK434]TCP55778.1 iron complex transport system permease protein [Tumebacillus sp. BK434]